MRGEMRKHGDNVYDQGDPWKVEVITWKILTYLLSFLRANTACLDFAMLAFENIPKGPSMAIVAVPQKESCVRLDHDE
jgi:hypothetical protein